MLVNVSNSIKYALDFLYKKQMPHGEFKTFVSADINLRNQYKYISTTYITSFVLYSISFADYPLVQYMKTKALTFLIEEMEEQGIWRFFTVNRNIKLTKGCLMQYTQMGILPDLDDTACIAFCLKQCNRNIPDNIKFFLNNRNIEGLYYTWLMNVPKRKEYTQSTIYMDISQNDLCSGVNANILLYLGEGEYTSPIVDYLNHIIIDDKIDKSYVYFPNDLAIYYLISRAYFNGAEGLCKSKQRVAENVKKKSEGNGGIISPLNTAYVLCTLLNYGIWEEYLHDAVVYLLSTQNQDGSWGKERFCDGGAYYYGSEELTTALCIEALVRYELLFKAVQHCEDNSESKK